jgi:hypothetical protein
MSRALALLLLTLFIGCAIPDRRCVPPPRTPLAPPADPTIKPAQAKATVAVTTRPATKAEVSAAAARVTTKEVLVKAPLTRRATAPLVTKRPRVRLAKAVAAPPPATAPTPLAIVPAPAAPPESEPPPTPAPARAPFPAPPAAGAPSPLVGERGAMIFAVLALAVGTLAVPLLLRRAPALGRAPLWVGVWLMLIVRRWTRR